MPMTSDKRIADWLNVSIATLYRWREAGLLPRRPKCREEAEVMRRRIDAAKDDAILARKRGQSGRTSLNAVVQALGGHK